MSRSRAILIALLAVATLLAGGYVGRMDERTRWQDATGQINP